MKIKTFFIILSIFWVQDTYGWLFSLDLNLNSALKPGGAYIANKGSYSYLFMLFFRLLSLLSWKCPCYIFTDFFSTS